MAEKKKRRKKHYLLRIAIVIAVLVGLWFIAHMDCFNVKGIAVIGNTDISDEEIQHLSGLEAGESIFDVHPLIVEHRIKECLYIEDVNVDRKFPDEVEISVTERSGNVQVKKGGKYIVVANDRTVIEISETEKKATLIEGVTVTEAEPGHEIEVKEDRVFSRALKFAETAEKNDLFFKKVKMEDGKVRAYVYDRLVCCGTYDNMIHSIRSGTLKSVIYDLYQKDTEKGTINVYDNDYCFFTP